MDLKGIALDAAPGLYMDMLAGDKSIIRKVFGTYLVLDILFF